MKKNAIKKLRSRSGESITETLVSVLIAALALVMLAGAVSAAFRLITRSETVMEPYYTGLNALGSPNKSGLSMTLKGTTATVNLIGGESATSVSVDYSVNAAFSSKPIIAYCKPDA